VEKHIHAGELEKMDRALAAARHKGSYNTPAGPSSAGFELRSGLPGANDETVTAVTLGT